MGEHCALGRWPEKKEISKESSFVFSWIWHSTTLALGQQDSCPEGSQTLNFGLSTLTSVTLMGLLILRCLDFHIATLLCSLCHLRK